MCQMNEAAMAALEEKLADSSSSGATSLTINAKHFDRALGKISPSVSDKVCVALFYSFFQHIYLGVK